MATVAVVRFSLVSDVHGNIDALADVARYADQLIVLGDLLDYVDYHEPGRGILGEVFGERKVRHFAALRSAGDFAALGEFNRGLWSSVADPLGILTEVVASRYRQVLHAVGPDAMLLLGNVDVVSMWNEVAGSALPYLDGETREVGGVRFGFVSGGSARPGVTLRPSGQVWKPFVRSADEYLAAVRGATDGGVDVLCSHLPPNIAGLRYDVLPGRLEMYGPGLVEAIDRWQPAHAVFGHVHQPLWQRARRGRTECLNTGHFQRFGRPTVLELDARTVRAGRALAR